MEQTKKEGGANFIGQNEIWLKRTKLIQPGPARFNKIDELV